jgi:hypothetical protein
VVLDDVKFKGVAVNYIARMVGIVSGVTVVVAAFGSGVASADPFVGITYSEAAAKAADADGKATVATVSGSQLATDDCVVVGWRRGNFLDASGNHHPKEYLMDLNCNSRLASPGHPGNSLASPTGRAEKHDEVIAAKIAKDPALPWCDEHAQRCQQVCENTGLCEYQAK